MSSHWGEGWSNPELFRGIKDKPRDRIALRIILLEVHTGRADLDKDLELIPNEDIAGDRNIAIGGLVLE